MNLRLTWSRKGVQGQPRLCRETLSQKKKIDANVKGPPGFIKVKKIIWKAEPGQHNPRFQLSPCQVKILSKVDAFF